MSRVIAFQDMLNSCIASGVARGRISEDTWEELLSNANFNTGSKSIWKAIKGFDNPLKQQQNNVEYTLEIVQFQKGRKIKAMISEKNLRSSKT